MHLGRVAFDPNTSAAAHEILGPSGTRTRLTIYAPSAGTATISNDAAVTVGNGITLTAGMAPLYLDVDFHGSAVTLPWYVIYSNSGQGLAWIDTQCQHQYDERDPHHAHLTTQRAKRSY